LAEFVLERSNNKNGIQQLTIQGGGTQNATTLSITIKNAILSITALGAYAECHNGTACFKNETFF
jgi:hypothetical protein